MVAAPGTFEGEEMTLLAVTDGNFSSSRTYDGAGTVWITGHDTGGADNEFNGRRMVITMEGITRGRVGGRRRRRRLGRLRPDEGLPLTVGGFRRPGLGEPELDSDL
jgi:hypothetical protein